MRYALALLALAPLTGCVTMSPPIHDYEQAKALDFSRVEQAENDYQVALALVEEVKDRLSHKRPAEDLQSQAETAAGMVVRAQAALKTMHASYDHKDAVTFERATGDLRLISQQIYSFTQSLPPQEHHHG